MYWMTSNVCSGTPDELRFSEGDAFHPILATRARKRLLRLPF
jgi:hypothetical protein